MKIFGKIILLFETVLLVSFFLCRFSIFPERRNLNFSGKKKITINDVGLTYETSTQARQISDLIAEKKIQLDARDEMFPAKNTEILPDMTISINRIAGIVLSADGKKIEKQTFAKTVEDALWEENISLSHLDKVAPPLETRLKNGTDISVTRIKTEEVSEEEPIEFPVVKQKDNQVDWGQKEISQTGKNGTRETVYRIHYENGVPISKTKLNSKITQTPVSQIVKIGTRIRIGKNDSGVASWYDAGPDECASRDYPPGTWLRVTSRASGKQIFVKVAGYGPQAGTGKLIDLDNKIFEKLAPLGQGTIKVKVEEVLNKGFNPDLDLK